MLSPLVDCTKGFRLEAWSTLLGGSMVMGGGEVHSDGMAMPDGSGLSSVLHLHIFLLLEQNRRIAHSSALKLVGVGLDEELASVSRMRVNGRRAAQNSVE